MTRVFLSTQTLAVEDIALEDTDIALGLVCFTTLIADASMREDELVNMAILNIFYCDVVCVMCVLWQSTGIGRINLFLVDDFSVRL